MRFKPTWLIVAAVVGLTVPALTAEAAGQDNVLVTFNVGAEEQGKEVVLKTYEMVVSTNSGPVEMSTGARIPIPTTSFRVAEDGSVPNPITSYTYQHVGFSAKVSATMGEDGRIFLRGHIEDSSLADKAEKLDRPFIQSMSQNLAVILENGKTRRIHRTDETDTRSLFVDVRAEVGG